MYNKRKLPFGADVTGQGEKEMKKAVVTLISVLMCCSLFASCMHPTDGGEMMTSQLETSAEDDSVKVGDHITFGKYGQKDAADPEPVEWRVLDVQDGKALVISEYLLAPMVYNYDLADVTWEMCSLRKWLNGTFYDEAFSDSEKSLIQTVTVKNPDNPEHGTNGGNDTEDKVFCLSLEEAQLYFKDADDRMAAPTESALKLGAEINGEVALENGMNTGWWWLRSPASSANRAADVDSYGNIDIGLPDGVNVDGDYVFSETNCVRPAMWIDISDKDAV